MKKSYLVAIALLTIQVANAQTSTLPRPCATNNIYRFFDFWIGEWEAFGAKGKAGESKISLILDSCVILEEWTSMQQGYAGKSFNTYNPQSKMWQQTWVDNRGGLTEYSNSVWEKDKMILTSANQSLPDGKQLIQRMTFTKLSNDKVRQHGENSNDGGKTWTTTFDLEYRRRK